MKSYKINLINSRHIFGISKTIFKTLLAVLIVTLSSCKDELTSDTIGLSTEGGIVTLPVIENSVSSSYQLLSSKLNILGNWNWGGGLVFRNDIIMQDIASDDMEKKWSSDGDQPWMDEINNFTFTSTNGGPNGLWKYDYEAIRRLNLSIDLLTRSDIEEATGITTSRKNQLLGEALFLRSFYYFDLVNNFGDVPLIVKSVTSLDEAFSVAVRADKADVLTKIKEDLATARTLIPDGKYPSSSEKWRASKGAVIAMQAKVALYTEQWNDVLTYINDLDALGYYSLDTNYFDNFSTEFTDNEVIFAYDHQAGQNPAKGNGICAVAGWGFFAPSSDLLAAFETNDPRLLYTVDVANQNVNKILGSTNGTNKGNDDAPNNKIYIRYGDVLLWKAEAMNETGNYSGAIAAINQIRARARNTVTATGGTTPAGTLPDRPASTDKTTIKNWLISERRVELAFEGQRMLDLKRWGIAKQVMVAAGKNFQDKHMLYPIPQTEIDASAGTLTQNPGY